MRSTTGQWRVRWEVNQEALRLFRLLFDLTDDADDRIMGGFATFNASLSRPIDLNPTPRLTLGQQLRQKHRLSGDLPASKDDESVLGIKKTCTSCNDEIPFFSAGVVLQAYTTEAFSCVRF